MSEWSTALPKVITDASDSVSRTASLSAGSHLQLKLSSILDPSRFASCLEWEQQRKPTVAVRGGLANLKSSFSVVSNLPREGVSWSCCGIEFIARKAPFKRRSKFVILSSNIYFWSHLAVVFFNLVDFVKDITFATAVQHFDTNIVQSEYEQYFDFNVQYVFIISVSLMVVAQVITYIYWSMITKKPAFLLSCEHQNLVTRVLLQLVQYIPSTLPIVLFAQDSSVKLDLGEQEDSVMDPDTYHRTMELLNEERLLEKVALNIKIIEVVVEAYGQLIIQSIVLLRLRALIQTDYFSLWLLSLFFLFHVFNTCFLTSLSANVLRMPLGTL